jgi:O-6-methylguanine DNA methyltransferase
MSARARPTGPAAAAAATDATPSKPGRLRLRHASTPTAWGTLFVAVSSAGIRRLVLEPAGDVAGEPGRLQAEHPGAEVVPDPIGLAPLLERLRGFLSDGDECRDVALDLSGGTPLQRRVWEGVRRIPRGQTRTYGEIARAIGLPRAARAVGSACAANPVMLLVPCHRVVRAGGPARAGDAGSERRRFLLQLEADAKAGSPPHALKKGVRARRRR